MLHSSRIKTNNVFDATGPPIPVLQLHTRFSGETKRLTGGGREYSYIRWIVRKHGYMNIHRSITPLATPLTRVKTS